ncbi:PilN domain-containing protein, partial [Bacteriovorax sp. DB6_IX]
LLTAFDQQIKKLKTRELQVEQVLKQKTNPKNILSALSKIVPEDLWFDKMSINKEKRLFLEGGAVSYRSV